MARLSSTLALASITLAATANAQISIQSGFDVRQGWRSQLIGMTGPGSVAYFTSNGNPGPYWQIGFSVAPNQPVGAAGIRRTQPLDLSSVDGGSVSLTTDYRFSQSAGNTAPDLTVVLIQSDIQGDRAYYPSTPLLDAGDSPSWVSLPTTTWQLDDFINSSGIPLDLSQPVELAIVGWLDNPASDALATTFSLDNVDVTFVPSPATTALLLPMLACARRRR